MTTTTSTTTNRRLTYPADAAGHIPRDRVAAVEAALTAYQDAKAAFKEAGKDRGTDRQTWAAASQRMFDARQRLVAEIVALPDEFFVLAGRTSDGRLVLLAASAKHPGRWQTSRFDEAGVPFGDSEYDLKERAVSETLREIDLESLRETMRLPLRPERRDLEGTGDGAPQRERMRA